MSLLNWLDNTPLCVLALLLLAAMIAASAAGYALRRLQHRRSENSRADEHAENEEAYIVSAVLGLLALLMAFTFALAIDRFETRRELVVAEANAIGTAYLRVQLLGEPHRARLSKLLIEYTDNKIALAKAPKDERHELIAEDDRMLTAIWSATGAAFESVKGLDFSSTFVESMNAMIDLDALRRAARLAQVPTEVFAVLLVYLIVTAGVLGYVLTGPGGRYSAGVLLALLTLALVLIIDIDRPTGGSIREAQEPMENLLHSLKSQPPADHDR